MRFAWHGAMSSARLACLCLAVAACSDPPKPATCGLVCRPEHRRCAALPLNDLPPECRELCYWGGCCELVDGEWQMTIADCYLPPVDAGIDAMDAP